MMRVLRVEVYKADIPLVAPFRIALGETTVAENVFVKINTDVGLYGLGEASPFTPIVGETQATDLVAAKDLAKLLIGKNPLDIELGVHGIHVKRGWSSGCFLPQVATETGWSKEEFLSNCCSHKAGLPPDAWKDSKTEVLVFTAEVVEE